MPTGDGKEWHGDRHVLVIDRDTNRLYEMFNSWPLQDVSWKADAGAIFHLDSDNVRPTAKPGWTTCKTNKRFCCEASSWLNSTLESFSAVVACFRSSSAKSPSNCRMPACVVRLAAVS